MAPLEAARLRRLDLYASAKGRHDVSMEKRKPGRRDRAIIVEFWFVGLLTAFMLVSGLVEIFR